MKPLVIYHDHCTDGFGAAFAAWLKFGDEAEYWPYSYTKETATEPLRAVTGREVYILDFSFPKQIMDYIFAHAQKVVWLDHHKTAFEMWCGGIPESGFHGEADEDGSNRHIHLSDTQSGAMLAWKYFHPGTEVPMLIKHIDDRDRWQFKLEGSKELHAALASYKPWNFWMWMELNNQLNNYDDHCGDFPHYIFKEGAAILRAQDADVARMAQQARSCAIYDYDGEMLGSRGLAVNASLHQSELGHVLANQSGTFGLVWYLGADNKVKLSFRSNGDYDVSAIAKAYGGGGHKNAAGAETDIETLMGWLK